MYHATAKKVKGGIALSVVCDKCGEPIVSTDRYGMLCKNRCNEKANKAAYGQMRKMLGVFEKLMEG